MAETNPEQTGPEPFLGNSLTESAGSGGFLHMEEKEEGSETTTPSQNTQGTVARSTVVPISTSALERTGTAEHLAARRPFVALNVEEQDVKNRLNQLRVEVTRLVTGLRWGGQSIDETTTHIIPLLNLGPLQQWQPVLIPFLFEIDRAGNLIPVWLKVIEHEDVQDLPATANPAETPIGRARRYAIMMLGNYKSQDSANQSKSVGFAKANMNVETSKTPDFIKTPEFIKTLGKLSTDPNTSLYATQSLAKQNITPAIQVLLSSLKDARGWAKIDIIEAILSLKQGQFDEIVLASGLDRVAGLESYVAVPIYQSIPLGNYLRGDGDISPRLSEQAALVIGQVLQDSMILPKQGTNEVPLILEKDFPPLAYALFEGARRNPTWQATLALHRLGLFLGRYWAEASRGAIQNTRILDATYTMSPMMNDVERWMSGPGRDVLLAALPQADDTSLPLIVKALGELQDPRATSLLLARLDTTNELTSREQALTLATICDTLVRLGDRRAIPAMGQLLSRVVDTGRRSQLPKRRDNLPMGDKDIPGSILYAAVLRSYGLFGVRETLDSVLAGTRDFDPYVRVQALEALKRIDPPGVDSRSHLVAREALHDPRDTVMKVAAQLVVQYRDNDAIPVLRGLVEARNDLSPTAYDALRRLGA